VKSIILTLLCLLVCSELHSQEIRYIRDTLYVPLRSGQTLQHRIVHKGLVSGTKLTLLETSEDNVYSKVQTSRGIEGWIQAQYLSLEPAGRDLFKQSQKDSVDLKNQNTELAEQLTSLQAQHRQSQREIEQLSSQNNKLSNELESIKSISANAITLDSENKLLLEESQSLKNQTDVLKADNKHLQDNRENDAFLNGAFAVVIGVMIALVVPRLRPKKSSEWA
jgi:SH3 domain protein